jgi:DNA polymerase III alpha subunit
MSNIESIKEIGVEETFDLEVDHIDHQFYLSNRILTSNSHATAYAIDSYMCAYLMTYHQDEWMCAYLESMSTNNDKKAKAFLEAKNLGYQVVPIDINEAKIGWTALPGKRLMPSFTSINHVGETAAQEIIQNRPYNSFEEILWNPDGSWKPSKFNKKALQALINIGAFTSLDCIGEGKLFDSYAHMYETLFGSYEETVLKKARGTSEKSEHVMKREHFTLIRKSTKSNPHLGMDNFYKLTQKVREQNINPWTKREWAERSISSFGSLDISTLIDPKIIEILNNKDIQSIDEFNNEDVYWFYISSITEKNSSSGKKYLLFNIQGESGAEYRLYCWNWDGIRKFKLYTLCCAQIKKSEFGFNTSIKKIREIG